MLTVFTGANRDLSDALVRQVGACLAQEDDEAIIVVPKQLTLLTERMLLHELKLRGSFRIRVIAPARLCTQIFEAAGFADVVHIDERGRVMLVRQAIRAAEGLSIYRDADRRHGFAEKCARQIEVFMQGGVSPEDLRTCAGECAGSSRMKLNDLAAIYESYTALTQDQYLDGERALIEAGKRIPGAPFIRSAHFFFFGFDLMPPTLTQLIAGIAASAPAAEMFFPLKNDRTAPDFEVYQPIENQLYRLCRDCDAVGAEVQRKEVQPAERTDAIAAAAHALYTHPVHVYAQPQSEIALVLAKDVREECRIAAAMARRLAMGGMRWGEMQVLCADIASYRQALEEAFAQYEIPLVTESSRPVSRTAVAECLLTALRLIDRNFRSEDVFALMRTGCADLTPDEADRLTNYAVKNGVDNGRWLRPLTRGREEEIAALEPVRKRLIAPVAQLKEGLKSAKDLKGQLRALFSFMQAIGAYEKSLALQREFEQSGMREDASTLAQSWNRVIGALDQMAALMGEHKLSARELSQTLAESLDAAIVKPLPQSGDAVYAQSTGRMLMQKARALFVMGLSDNAGAKDDGLLTQTQRSTIVRMTNAYLGPDVEDTALLRRFYLKEGLGMAEEHVLFSCALSGADGAAQSPGADITALRAVLPDLQPMCGEETSRLQLNALSAAAARAAIAISERTVGKAAAESDRIAEATLRHAAEHSSAAAEKLARVSGLLQKNAERANLDVSSARAVYGELQSMSITRLEGFAQCPFSFFVKYGLHADKVEEFKLDPRDEGSFLHKAVCEFLRTYGQKLDAMSGDEAEERMRRIAEEHLKDPNTAAKLEDSAASRAEADSMCRVACECARVLTEQMRGSAFLPESLEYEFGPEQRAQALRAGDMTLDGKIDRVDRWRAGGSLRVIDYKLSGKNADLAGMYHGLELQLPIYLGAAQKHADGRCAGLYYFPLDKFIVETQETDPAAVEAERRKQTHMSGILPADRELVDAQTPNPEDVLGAKYTKDGRGDSHKIWATDADFDRIVRHALKCAQAHAAQIRAGDVRVAPVEHEKKKPCTYCDYRAACLFDTKLDASCVRRPPKMRPAEVLEKLALEDGETAE